MSTFAVRRVAAILMLILWSAASFAQQSGNPIVTADTNDSGAIPEIVVTAQLRSEALQTVPISAEVFAQWQLDLKGVRSIDDLARVSPGVTFIRNGTGPNGNYNDADSDISIRGVESTAGTSTTGIYIDDTPIQGRRLGFSTLNAFPALEDLGRVEILRGPQGTLFGSGSEGGTLRFIRPEPRFDDFSGKLRSEVAFTEGGSPTYDQMAAISGQIVDDKLTFRVSGSYRHDGGWVDRVDYRTLAAIDRNANWQNTEVVSAAITWKPVDALAVTPTFYYQRQHINDTAAYWPQLSDPAAGRLRNGNAQEDQSTDPFYLASIKAVLTLEDVQLTSISSYFSRRQSSVLDNTQFDRAILALSPLPAAGDAGTTRSSDTQRNFYQEARIQFDVPEASLKWTAGVFYAHLNENATESIVDPTLNGEFFGGLILCSAVACPGGLLLDQPELRTIDTQVAGYGQADLQVTDSLKITAGIRVSRTEFTGDVSAHGAFIGVKQ